MRALAGPAMLAVIVGGFFITKQCSAEKIPPRDFTALEFTGVDESGTMLFAEYDPRRQSPHERIDEHVGIAARRNVAAEARIGGAGIWRPPAPVPHVDVRAVRRARASRLGRRVEEPANTIQSNIDDLLDAPTSLRSTPVDRCGKNGGAGYRYKPR